MMGRIQDRGLGVIQEALGAWGGGLKPKHGCPKSLPWLQVHLRRPGACRCSVRATPVVCPSCTTLSALRHLTHHPDPKGPHTVPPPMGGHATGIHPSH